MAGYLSPEQASGQFATPASDLYALGVVAYECLAGRRPFTGEHPIAVALAHLLQPPPPLPDEVPQQVRGLVAQAMAKTADTPATGCLDVRPPTAELAKRLGGHSWTPARPVGLASSNTDQSTDRPPRQVFGHGSLEQVDDRSRPAA